MGRVKIGLAPAPRPECPWRALPSSKAVSGHPTQRSQLCLVLSSSLQLSVPSRRAFLHITTTMATLSQQVLGAATALGKGKRCIWGPVGVAGGGAAVHLSLHLSLIVWAAI